ncbi:MAG: molybdopterin-dependent oxidoreductase, partial [Methylocella sp.]
MSSIQLPRRRFLALGAASLGGTLLSGCDRLSEAPNFKEFLASAEWLTYRVQRLLGGRHALAREFEPADISPVFKVNGTTMPDSEEYAVLRENNFAEWRLRVDGLVAKPLDLSLADLRKLPQRTQITRHDCVEGWSVIGKWQGVPLAVVLAR